MTRVDLELLKRGRCVWGISRLERNEPPLLALHFGPVEWIDKAAAVVCLDDGTGAVSLFANSVFHSEPDAREALLKICNGAMEACVRSGQVTQAKVWSEQEYQLKMNPKDIPIYKSEYCRGHK